MDEPKTRKETKKPAKEKRADVYSKKHVRIKAISRGSLCK